MTLQRKLLLVCFAGAAALSLPGCPEDQFAASTWTKKLDDTKEVENAVTALERLGDPSAIPALGKAWEKQGRPERILRVIIDLAKPLTKEQAKADYKNYKNGDYQAREASWDKALPFLIKAIEEVDGANPRSVESARLAAEALGDSKIDAALEALKTAANNASVRQLRGQAILSLGELGNPGAVDVLANIIREEFDPTKPEMPGVAIIALGKLKNEKAIPVLIEAMYRLPFFFKQIRRSLVASGGQLVSERIGKILRHQDGDVNALFKESQLDTYKGDLGKEPLPQAEWQKVSAMDYYAAIIAGDLYDPALVGPLLEALAREPLPAYYVDSAPGPSAQNAILDSLRKIGSPQATDAVLAVWATGKDDQLKPMAANVFSFVSRNGSEKVGTSTALDALGKIAADNGADQTLRLEASVAYGRLSSSKDRVPLLLEQAKKYKEASDKAQAEADGAPKKAYEAAKATYDAAKQNLDEAKAKVARAGGERKAPIELINGTTTAKVEFDKVKDPFTKAKSAWKALDDKAKAYRGFQRLFETHVARIEIAIHCGQKVECYAGTVDPSKKWEDQWAALAPRLKALSSSIQVDKYTEEEKKEALAAQIERAMLELGKMGSKASSATPLLLDAVKSDDRIIRQSILLALPKVAGKTCKDCGAKLDAAIKAGEGKTTLGDLNFETQVLRSYFGGESTDDAAAPAEAPADK